MGMFRQWALEKSLKPSETHYVRRTRTGTVDLQFSKSGDPSIEKNSGLTMFPRPCPRANQGAAQKLSSPATPVVFEILRDSACSECGAELSQGNFLVMEAEQPLCLPCARLDDLEYLPAGNTALTRRAARYSERTAVVVRASVGRAGVTNGRASWLKNPHWKKRNKNAQRTPGTVQKQGLPALRGDRNKTAN